MKIVLSKTNREFINSFHNELFTHSIETCLIQRNLINLDQQLDITAFRGGIYDNDKLCLIFLNPIPYKLQIISFTEDLLVFDELAKFIIDNDLYITGVQGNIFDTQQFINSYNQLTGKLFNYKLSMDILKLTSESFIKPSNTLPNGKIRKPTKDDFDLLISWYRDFIFEALGEKISDEDAILSASKLLNRDYFYIYENDEGHPTSFMACNELFDLFIINHVYTYKPYRNKGYAKNMITIVCRDLFKVFNTVILFVDKLNPIANKLYKDIGFIKVCDNYACELIN